MCGKLKKNWGHKRNKICLIVSNLIEVTEQFLETIYKLNVYLKNL